MTRYPQAIPGKQGVICPYCGRRKHWLAEYCRKCDPAFQSFSRAKAWAKQNADGPCVVICRDVINGYMYISCKPAEKGAAA